MGVALPPQVLSATHAPVAQTMGDEMGRMRRSRAPIFVIAGMLLVAGVGAGIFFGMRTRNQSQAATEPSAPAPTVEVTETPDVPPEPEVDRNGIEGDHHAQVNNTKTAQSSAPPVKSSAPIAHLPSGKLPAPPPPSQPKTPDVRPGDDKFNTFKP
jgi:hypothetical protein